MTSSKKGTVKIIVEITRQTKSQLDLLKSVGKSPSDIFTQAVKALMRKNTRKLKQIIDAANVESEEETVNEDHLDTDQSDHGFMNGAGPHQPSAH